jgi:hypothetical protein
MKLFGMQSECTIGIDQKTTSYNPQEKKKYADDKRLLADGN